MNIIVLGAGFVGITSAWYLHKAGHHVTVVDRQPHAASETSFANGGQLSVCHSQPWANPDTLKTLWHSLRDPRAPLHVRPNADPQFWGWWARFMRECTPQRSLHNMAQLIALGLHSRAALHALRAELALEYQQRRCGILHVYSQRSSLEAGLRCAAQMRALGCERHALDVDELIALEPALKSALQRSVIGGTFTPDDESGDAHTFTCALAQHLHARGVTFRYGHSVTALRADGRRIRHVEARDAQHQSVELHGDAVVVALGWNAPALLRPLGIPLWIQPAKGYSMTVPVYEAASGYQRSLIDDEAKLVFSRFGDYLRVAGTGQLGGVDLRIEAHRCDLLKTRLHHWFGDVADLDAARFWCGLRPATPSNVPYIGVSRYPNLWLNCGHGTLGWTLACGSGQALAALIDHRDPQVNFAFTNKTV